MDKDVVDAGKYHLQLIETTKEQFKEYSKLWVEINYTASAYDEMSMCKGRIQVLDANSMTKEDFKSKQKIPSYEVENQRNLFESQKNEAHKLKPRNNTSNIEKRVWIIIITIYDSENAWKNEIMNFINQKIK